MKIVRFPIILLFFVQGTKFRSFRPRTAISRFRSFFVQNDFFGSLMLTIENLFHLYLVPKDMRPPLLMPYLSVIAKKIVCNMKSDETKPYDWIRKALIREFHQTAKKY